MMEQLLVTPRHWEMWLELCERHAARVAELDARAVLLLDEAPDDAADPVAWAITRAQEVEAELGEQPDGDDVSDEASLPSEEAAQPPPPDSPDTARPSWTSVWRRRPVLVGFAMAVAMLILVLVPRERAPREPDVVPKGVAHARPLGRLELDVAPPGGLAVSVGPKTVEPGGRVPVRTGPGTAIVWWTQAPEGWRGTAWLETAAGEGAPVPLTPGGSAEVGAVTKVTTAVVITLEPLGAAGSATRFTFELDVVEGP